MKEKLYYRNLDYSMTGILLFFLTYILHNFYDVQHLSCTSISHSLNWLFTWPVYG
jgi:hypothetical protein